MSERDASVIYDVIKS